MGVQQVTFISILSVAILGLSACGGGDDGGSSSGSGSVSLSAVIDGTYNVAYTPTLIDHVKDLILGERAIAVSSGTVDKVVAIPTYKGSYGPAFMDLMVTADVANDGSFNLSLDGSYEWVVLLTDSTATNAEDKVAGYVALTVDASDNLVAFSGSTIASSVDLGTLSKTGNEAQSSRTAGDNSSSFNLTIDQLASLARSDGSYKHLINLYLNYNPATKETLRTIQNEYDWKADTIANVGNRPTTGSHIEAYAIPGFRIGIESAALDNPTLEEVCTQQKTMGLFPASDITDSTSTYVWNAASGFENDGSDRNTISPVPAAELIGPTNTSWSSLNGCTDDDFAISQLPGSTTRMLTFAAVDVINAPLEVPINGFPEGLWQLKVGVAVVAEFDMAVSTPVNSNGKFDTVPIPAVTVDYDVSTGAINGLIVNWYQYDSSSDAYVELTADQIQGFEASFLVRDTFIYIQDEDGTDLNPVTVSLLNEDNSGYPNQLLDGSGIVFSTGGTPWYMPGSVGDIDENLVPTQIRIGMHMGGSLYNFNWGY